MAASSAFRLSAHLDRSCGGGLMHLAWAFAASSAMPLPTQTWSERPAFMTSSRFRWLGINSVLYPRSALSTGQASPLKSAVALRSTSCRLMRPN